MTRDEILALPAGRELDALVAERVMGQVWQGGAPIPGYDGHWPWPPPYSTDIAAAWLVVEKLQAIGYTVLLHAFGKDDCDEQEACIFRDWWNTDYDSPDWFASAPAIHHAIARAALIAVTKEAPCAS